MKSFSGAIAILLACAIEPINATLTTEYLLANGLNFTCTVLKHTSNTPGAPVKDIMLLHGFPMFRVWWLPLLEYWDGLLEEKGELTVTTATAKSFSSATLDLSVHAVACDLRGYSPGASPDNIEAYDYSLFADDTFALGETAGFDQGFHLVGHDHGAALAWYVAGHDPNNQVLSLSTMSVPHLDLFGEALCGDNTDEDQVVASNYFNQFSLPDSASRNNAGLTNLFASFGMEGLEPIQFQKMLWWYNGSLAKHFSMPRVVSDAEVEAFATKYGAEVAGFVQGARSAIPMEERPCIPIKEERKTGPIVVPTLFICGLNDFALLCNNPYATDYPPELLPNYEHANFACGHDFFLEGQCSTMDESQAVIDKITKFVFGETEKGEDTTDSHTQESESSDDSPDSGSFEMLASKIPFLMASGGAVVASSSIFW